MKELFGVQDGCEVCLWSKHGSSSYDVLDRMDMTLQDSSIHTGHVKEHVYGSASVVCHVIVCQRLVLEVRNEERSWPRVKESQVWKKK